MTDPAPAAPTAAEPEGTLSTRFVVAAVALSVAVAVGLCLVLPAWAGQVAQTAVPAGAVTVGRISLQPQPGWEELPPENGVVYLSKEGVVLALQSVPAEPGATPREYLDALLAEFAAIPDYEPVPFRTPTDDPGEAVLAGSVDESGMYGAIIARDGRDAAVVAAVGDPVAVTALVPEISTMITSIRIRGSR